MNTKGAYCEAGHFEKGESRQVGIADSNPTFPDSRAGGRTAPTVSKQGLSTRGEWETNISQDRRLNSDQPHRPCQISG